MLAGERRKPGRCCTSWILMVAEDQFGLSARAVRTAARFLMSVGELPPAPPGSRFRAGGSEKMVLRVGDADVGAKKKISKKKSKTNKR